jgi:hypothetical protein
MSIEIGKVANIQEEEEIVMVTTEVERPISKPPSREELKPTSMEIDTKASKSTSSPISPMSGLSNDTLGPLPAVKKTRIEFDDPKSRNSLSIMPNRTKESMFHKEAKRAQSMDVRREPLCIDD